MRAFIAIQLPREVQASLAHLQRELAVSQADVKWVPSEQLHVTLKFLDEISDAQRHAVEALLARVGASAAPFLLGVEGVGAFPSIGAPRVLWVGLGAGKEQVRRLAEAIEREGTAMSLRKEERPFATHITVGRVRSSTSQQALTAQLRDPRWQPPSPWRATSLTLYQSVLSSSGPRYTVLAELPLTQ